MGMLRWVLAAVVLLTVALAGMAATPVAELERRALAEMQGGNYAEAQRLLEEVVEREPDSPRALYNLACCLSRQGDLDRAAERLEAAWQAGFRDLELIGRDPDLEALRRSDAGRELVERLGRAAEEERRRFGEPVLFDAAVVASGRLLRPAQVEPGRRYPLLVVLHGYGATAEGAVSLFSAAGLSPELLVFAPSAPYPAMFRDGLGFSWFPSLPLVNEVTAGFGSAHSPQAVERRRALERREQAASEAYVLASLDAVLREQPADPGAVFLLGHSQGGALAYGLALGHPERFRGLVTVGARLREEDASAERLERAAGRLRVLVCHSPEDRAVDIAEGRSAQRRLRQGGVDSRLVRYSGGHGFSVELLREIAGWIGEVANGRPPALLAQPQRGW